MCRTDGFEGVREPIGCRKTVGPDHEFGRRMDTQELMETINGRAFGEPHTTSREIQSRDRPVDSLESRGSTAAFQNTADEASLLYGTVGVTAGRGNMIYDAFFYGASLTLALNDDDDRPSRLYEDLFKLAEGIHGESAEQSLYVGFNYVLCQGQLAEFGDFADVGLGGPRCQILSIIDLKESANLV
jgi:hypothetical protein